MEVPVLYFPDFKFVMSPPSMIAAASVSAATCGLVGYAWCAEVGLMERLQKITTIDAVSVVRTSERVRSCGH